MNEGADKLQPDYPNQYQIQVDFPGLIDLLSNQLYKDKSAAVRELLSNANDALRTRSRDIDDPTYSPAIRLWLDQSGRLVIRDNGIGMSEEDLKQYLATIGASLARERRKTRQTAGLFEDLVGRFGIGFLSSFIVADRVVVDTKQQSGPGLRWTSGGERGYNILSQDALDEGTTISLQLKPAVSKEWTAERLKRLVLENARNFLFPIYWGAAGDEKLNTLEAPWYSVRQLEESDQEELRSFLAKYDERFASAINAVEILPIQTTDIRGVLYIPAISLDREAMGMVDLYCNRVFVAKDHADIVPDEFPFVKGVIDCALFHLNAARDEVLRDEIHAYVKEFLGKSIIEHLCALAKRASPSSLSDGKPDRFRLRLHTLLDQHHAVIKRALIKKLARGFLFADHILIALQDFIPFQGSKYPSTTLPEYLMRMKALGRENEILILHPDQDLAAHRLISEYENLEFIIVRHSVEREFLGRYAAAVGARCLSAADVFREHVKFPAIEGWEQIVGYYQHGLSHPEFTLTVSLSEFQPDTVPGRLLADKNSEGQQRLQELIKEMESSGVIDKHDPLYQELARLRQKRPHFLYLNKRHSVLLRLAELYRHGVNTEAELILHSMFHDMALAAGHPVHEAHIAEFQTKAYARILESVSARQEVNMLKVELEKTRPLSPTNDVFFIRPLKESFDYLSERMDAVCKSKGLNFVDPKKLTLPGEITAEIIEYLQRSKIVIADVSENNPNVYYELGFVRGYLAKKLVLVADRSVLDDKRLPFDIQALRVLGYSQQAKEFDRFIADLGSVISEMTAKKD